MKILYVTNERRSAQIAANALHGIAQDVTMSWAASLSAGLAWVHKNRDVGALVVDSEVQNLGCPPFVARVRELGLTVPVIVVVPETGRTPLAALSAGADDYVVNNQWILVDLPAILRRALRRTELTSRVAALQTQYDASVAEARATRTAFEKQLAAQGAEFTARLEHVTGDRDTLAQQLHDAVTALELARQQQTADAAAAAEQLERRETELAARLAEAIEIRHTLEDRLAAAAASQLAEERAAAEQVAAGNRHAELEACLAQEAARRTEVEQQLGEAETARKVAEERYSSELSAAAAHLAEREAQSDARLAQAAAARDALEGQVRDRMAALERAQQARAAEAVAEAERFRNREAELGTLLDESIAIRNALDYRITVVEAARARAERQASAEHEASAQVQAELEARLAQEAAMRKVFEQRLGDAEAALDEVCQSRAAEAVAASEQLRRREAELGAKLADSLATQNTLEQQLAAMQAALQNSERHASDRATASEALVGQESAARRAAEEKLAQAETTHKDVEERYASELRAAAARLDERQAQFDSTLADAAAARASLEQQVRAATAALDRAQQERAAETAAAAERLERREQELGAMLQEGDKSRHTLEQRLADAEASRQHADERAGRDRAAHERFVAEKQQQLQDLERARDSVQQSLAAAHVQLQRLNDALDQERQGREQDRLLAQNERDRQSAESVEAQRTLEQARADLQTLSRVSSEHAAEAVRLRTAVTERDAQLRELMARHQASQQAAKDALIEIEGRLRVAMESRDRDVATLRAELKAARQELELTRSDRESLRKDADRVPHLQTQLEQNRSEIRRLFEHTPSGICRWSREGGIVHVNRALVRLLGYRSAEELRAVDVATRVFESRDDFDWLLERCLTGGTSETVEATWRRKDGGRRMMRLVAAPISSEAVEIIAEDLTELRGIEEQLRQARRMEAVGRLASEVAVTCDNLLRDVTQGGQQWLHTLGSDTALRQQAELLLGEVTRAASFLRQLAVYGEQQTSALEPVNVNQVLRGLEPVLKLVAGDDIEFVLPKTTRPFYVDVAIERVERILVNVASYARERMPSGGRLKIELATARADRKFVAKYPNVRPGVHAVITVTEENARKAFNRPGHPNVLADSNARKSASEKPGVDLGVLLGLIGDCGGHLWMAADPPGNMVLKIHLPQRVSDSLTDPPAAATRSAAGRAMARLFGH